MIIRHAEPVDLDGLLALHVAQGNRTPGPPTEREAAAWNRMHATPDLAVYLAVFADAIVGTATAMALPHITYGCAPTLFVEAVLVHPNWRRHGIATALMRRVLADAAAAGCHKIQLLSHKRHSADGAHDLYRNLGFVAEAEGFRLYLPTD